MENTNKRYETVTQNVKLLRTGLFDEELLRIPDGKVVRMGVVLKGNTEDRIINASVLDNNNEIIRPIETGFLQKTASGSFLEGFMPVDFEGGRQYQVRLTALVLPLGVEEPVAQFLFIIEKR
jgi:hypothetical protein